MAAKKKKTKPATKVKPKKKAKPDAKLVKAVAKAAGWVAGAVAGTGPGSPSITPTRDLFGSIQQRRSHKKFKPDPVDAETIRVLLDAAVLAPNHKMTQPWGFLVFGTRAKHAYADTKARLKLRDNMGAEAQSKAMQMISEILAIPCILGVTQKVDGDPHRAEEDFAAVFMAIQNLLLAATAMGLGTKIHTGDILVDPIFRSSLGLADDERLVAIVDVGEPVEQPPPKSRAPAADKTRWLD